MGVQSNTFQLYEGLTKATVHPVDDGALIAESTSFTADPDDDTLYHVSFTNVPVGIYRVNLYVGTRKVAFMPSVTFTDTAWYETGDAPPSVIPGPGPIPGGGVGIVNAGTVLPSAVKQFILPWAAASNTCRLSQSYPGYITKAGMRVGLIWSYPGVTIASETTPPGNADYDLSLMPTRYVAFRDPTGNKSVQLGLMQLGASGSNTLRLFPPSEVLNTVGIYDVEVVWTQNNITHSGSALLSVEQSLVGTALLGTEVGPLPYSAVQARIRDTLQDNDILGGYEFSAVEYITAMSEAVMYYNEAPPVDRGYSYNDFPYRFHWINATIARLLFTAALWQQRNVMDVSGEGIAANARAKYAQLMQISNALWEQYRVFVAATKQKGNHRLSFRAM